MACILNIETSTPVCSMSLSNDGKLIFNKAAFDGPSHASLVGVYAAEALEVMKSYGLKLDAVAVSSGPGSYTGLRIGVSFAKGLCFGEDIPLISIPTLDVIVASLLNSSASNAEYQSYQLCPMLDARRMEVYSAIYENGQTIRKVSADIISKYSYAEYLDKGKVCFFGNGAPKCREVIVNPNAVFINNIDPLAEYMVKLSDSAYLNKQFENVAYFEPFYLKEFQATVAKNKVLG